MEMEDDAAPSSSSGRFDMCHRVRVKSRRPKDFVIGATNDRNVDVRNAAFTILFMMY